MPLEKFKPGQMVNVLNTRFSGEIILEGRAKILRAADGCSQYVVDFQDGYGPLNRFVDPQAQGADVDAWIETLNNPAGKTSKNSQEMQGA